MRTLCLAAFLALATILAGCGDKPTPAPPAPLQQEQPSMAQPVAAEVSAAPAEAAPVVPAAPTAAASDPPGSYTVQVAAWATREEAEQLAQFYRQRGFEDVRMENADLQSGRWYRVRIGRYDSYQSARETADQLKEKYHSEIWMVRLN